MIFLHVLDALGSFKMGDAYLNCPLCCDKTFESKESLLEHLSNLEDLHCSVCDGKFPSLQRLTEHLKVDNCLPVSRTVTNIIFENNPDVENHEFQSENTDQIEFKTLDNVESMSDADDTFLPVQSLDSTDVNKMYVELIKPIETQELKLIKDSSDRYVLITNDTEFDQEAVVTKQNNDGTISLTSIKDMKMESDTLISQSDQETEGTQPEAYSCNTCGGSFVSIIEHIQNYHNGQDIFIEGQFNTGNGTLPLEFEAIRAEAEAETESIEKQPSRRVITDTGDIVETPFLRVTSGHISDNTAADEDTKEMKEQQVKEKRGGKRFVQVDKLCDSVIKDLKQNENAGPYHKVVVKEVVASNGSTMKMYRCMWCSITVRSLGDFKQHPCKTLKYKCTQCSVSYDNAKSLCAHMKVHKAKTSSADPLEVAREPFECEVCCTEFHTNKSLKLHRRMHDPPKLKPIEAPKKSEEDEKFHCNICSKMIPIEYKTVHQNYHKTDDSLNCTVCNKKFSSVEFLEMHMNVHNMDKAPITKQDQTLPYCCMYCDRRFARPHEKVKHERIHTGEKPHACEICGKSFRVSYCLTLHMRTHTGARPYECPHCGKRFKAHSVYNHHLLTHSEVRAYKCPFCPKAFKTSVQLAGHKNSHTKPFSCTHCNRPFASLYAVRVHTETHARQNNLKFSCSLCGASYARAFALKDHIKQVHNKEVDNVEPNDTNETLTEQDEWEVKEMNQLDNVNDELIVPN